MTLRNRTLAAVMAPLMLASVPAVSQEETGDRLIEALSQPVRQLAAIAGLTPEAVFAVPPEARQLGDGWQIDLPSWRVPYMDGRLLVGCGAQSWRATVARDGTIEARTESPLACELRAIGSEGLAQRTIIEGHVGTATIAPDGAQSFRIEGSGGSIEEKSVLGGSSATFGRLLFEIELEPDRQHGGDRVDLRVAGEMQGGRWEDRFTGIVMSSGAARYEAAYEDIDIGAVIGLMTGVAALEFDVTGIPDPASQSQLADLLPRFSDWLAAAEEEATVEDLAITIPFIGEFGFGMFSYAWAVEDVGTDALGGALEMRLSDGTFDRAGEAMAGWLPRHAAIEVELEGLPLETLLAQFAAIIRSGFDVWPGAVMADMGAALRGAGTRLSLETLEYRSSALTFEMAGEIAAVEGASLGLAAEAELLVTGLNGLIALVGTLPEGGEIAAVLTALSLVGQPAEPLEGEPARRFAFAIGRDGAITLNGTDLSALVP